MRDVRFNEAWTRINNHKFITHEKVIDPGEYFSRYGLLYWRLEVPTLQRLTQPLRYPLWRQCSHAQDKP